MRIGCPSALFFLLGFVCGAFYFTAVVGWKKKNGRFRLFSGFALCVQALTGMAFFAVYFRYGMGRETVLGILFASLLVLITLTDITDQSIPNRLLLPFFLLFLVLRFWHPYPGHGYVTHLASTAAAFLCFWMFAAASGGIGGGDIKLYAVIGMFLPPFPLFRAVLLSSIIGCLTVAVMLLLQRIKRRQMVAYGPFIAIGSFLSYLYGDVCPVGFNCG
ncbi:prepilin peptidase [Brevibacillus fulvus]|uniref:Leader peptidase (Prepilin peptidase)/N-methyltransferase n=1 Tax=Brevibacillus fulvus TaxID=1125967 RepID=A0A939BS56_9BACL|nr:A24 family peptidase [Brevibacillus fulvus]MBM7590357.1 leader peptidase (prepilin peptidase)/N-methyltransferase [Brevibacillus fulvus]